MFALVLTGPPGAGKTSVMEALSDALVVEDVQHAMIEAEALTSAHPALDDDQWLAAVQAVCGLYRRFGYELLLVAATLEADDDLRCLLAAVGADEHAVVRLEADAETLRRRIVEREPEGWSEPFEPSPSGVAETEHFGSRFPASEGEPPEDAEHAALARPREECGRELGAEDAGARIGAHRHRRIERDPIEVAAAPEALDLRAKSRLLLRREEDVDVGVEHAGMRVFGQLLDELRQHRARVRANHGHAAGGRVVGGLIEPPQRLDHRRRAGAQPRTDVGIADVERLAVDADAGDHGRR